MHEMRMANVRASFWDNGGWCSVTFSRLYQLQKPVKGEGWVKTWDSTTSFRRTDMGNLALLATKAEAWMESWMNRQEDVEKSDVNAA
jgi:hypothetical protein